MGTTFWGLRACISEFVRGWSTRLIARNHEMDCARHTRRRHDPASYVQKDDIKVGSRNQDEE
jgi:hypothetical protein